MRDKAGDRVCGPYASFDAFAADVARPLFRTAWLLTGDWYLAEDLVQEALARMYRIWPAPIDHPLAYARRILVRTFLSHRRRRSSSEQPTETLPEHGVHDSDAALRQTLLAALQTLSERDRAVLVLRYLADRSVEDVARDLGRSPGAIRVQSLRALAKLRAVLGDTELDLVNP
jgi:RNA polymerase sigma-70 factor (sigma-E family)